MSDPDRNPVQGLLESLHTHCACVQEHGQRVCALSYRLGAQLDFPDRQLRLLSTAARLHDVGKVFIPCALLSKAGALTAAESAKVRQHPLMGAQLLARVPASGSALAAWVLHHHERFDGTGYPAGLTGSQIPLGSRIIALADAWDVMTSGRPYQSPIPADTCLGEIADRAGTQFDPAVAEALFSLQRSGKLRPGSPRTTCSVRRGASPPRALCAVCAIDSVVPDL